ncbi:MAG: hypothetical protein ABIH65_03150 [Nanoarchaeota archaeon]
MGISLLTALTIQENRTEIAVYNEGGKFGFYIYSVIRSNHRPQITSKPVYDSSEIAKKEGEKLLDEIKSLDLDKNRTELSNLLGDAAGAVEKIVSASKSRG